jgi:ribosomal protein L30E
MKSRCGCLENRGGRMNNILSSEMGSFISEEIQEALEKKIKEILPNWKYKLLKKHPNKILKKLLLLGIDIVIIHYNVPFIEHKVSIKYKGKEYPVYHYQSSVMNLGAMAEMENLGRTNRQ